MCCKYPYISGIDYESAADGPGIRAVFFLSGCNHHCKNCHNPDTHNPEYGQPITDEMIQQMADEIASRPYLSGITLSGGDPLYSFEKTERFMSSLVKAVFERNKAFVNKPLWIYTGYTWEQIMALYDGNTAIQNILSYTDVVVDGKFVEELSDPSLSFRGSSNQRLIDVNESIGNDHIFHWKNSSSEV